MHAAPLTWRRATAADERALAHVVDASSIESLQARFLGPSDRDRALAWFTRSLRAPDVETWLAWRGATAIGIGSACYERGAGTLEVAVLVADRWQRQGVGYALVDAIAASARAQEITTMRATCASDRAAITIALGRGAGYRASASVSAGVVEVTFAPAA